MYSIGVGGHISEEDRGLFSQDASGYYDGMWRELKEEVDIEPLGEAAVAVINDDSTEVGLVHFGVVHIVRVASESGGVVRSATILLREPIESVRTLIR